MMAAPDLPMWAAIVVAMLVLFGAAATLLGAIGLVRLKTFYDRVHPPAIGMTMGNASILIASIVCFTVLLSRPVVHEILIIFFVTLTTPVTMMLLARAALFRDRSEEYDQRMAAAALAAAKEEAAQLEAAQAEAARHGQEADEAAAAAEEAAGGA